MSTHQTLSYRWTSRHLFEAIGFVITSIFALIAFTYLYIDAGKKYDATAFTLTPAVQVSELHDDQKVQLDEYMVLCEFESLTDVKTGEKTKNCAVAIVDRESEKAVYILAVEAELSKIRAASIYPPEPIGDGNISLYRVPIEGFLDSGSSAADQTMRDMRYLVTSQGMSQDDYDEMCLPYRLTDAKLGAHTSESRESDSRIYYLGGILLFSISTLLGVVMAIFLYKRLKTY